MLPGLMQERQLQIIDILKFAARAHPTVEIVSRRIDEPIFRYDYAGLLARSSQAAGALGALEVRAGDRVATLAWNTHRHLELFYAVPGLGAILHTVNPRLVDDQIAYILNHAESSVLVFEKSFIPLVERLASRLTSVKTFILMSSAEDHVSGPIDALCFETLLATQSNRFDWPAVDESAGAVLCYTSGTTGDPKGVLYSHRAIVLHAMAAGLSGAFGITAFDVIMPCASMYHATAWGLPYVAPINGAKLVLPADKMGGEALHELIANEGVTYTGGVPTIWTMYLDHLARTGDNTHALQRVVIGGSAVPRAMAQTFAERYGVKVLQIWGMTELSPTGVIATPTPALLAHGESYAQDVIWTRQGRLQFGVEVKVVAEDGSEVPSDGETSGALLVRGPWTIRRYFKAETDAVDDDGWFDTGDVVTLDAEGYIRITDRRKDVIKSGGEWISSIDLENAAVGFPGVKIAAVIGVPHPKWEERPILIIEPHDNAVIATEAVMEHLAGHVARWWLPDAIHIEPVPLTATGKIDKKQLRQRFVTTN
ncbi:MAG: long-chain fatty acid--CoA ligase [Rhizorhabdus sp.]|nr:long-chain fatty acid--CoA ligase [Rhizorhabdus sp.]